MKRARQQHPTLVGLLDNEARRCAAQALAYVRPTTAYRRTAARTFTMALQYLGVMNAEARRDGDQWRMAATTAASIMLTDRMWRAMRTAP